MKKLLNFIKNLLNTEEKEEEFKHCILCDYEGTREEIKEHLITTHKLRT